MTDSTIFKGNDVVIANESATLKYATSSLFAMMPSRGMKTSLFNAPIKAIPLNGNKEARHRRSSYSEGSTQAPAHRDTNIRETLNAKATDTT
jgi:hypothetical protein